MADKLTVDELLDAQKHFYIDLEENYRLDYKKNNKSKVDAFDAEILMKKNLRSLALDGFEFTGEDPFDIHEWSKSKKLNFERKNS